MQTRRSGFDRISTLKHLPSLPHILLKLIKVCNKPNGTTKEISSIIEKDPSLSGKILRLVNSAYFALPRKIQNVDQAVAYLGTGAIKNVAISASVFGAFGREKGDAVFNLKVFWWHSLRCAVLAKLISKEIRYPSPDEAFLSGLLHDIGKLVLWVNFKQEYGGLLSMYKDRPHLLTAGEIRLAATHAEIGAWLLERWNLQSFMVDSVLYHHESVNRIQDALPLVQIVYVANALGKAGPKEEPGLRAAADILGFGLSTMEGLLSKSDGELEEVARSLGIEIQAPEAKEPVFSQNDQQTLDELACEVRDVSLLLGTLQNLLEAQDEEMTIQALQQGLQILFDAKHVLFFFYDPDREGLTCKTVPGQKGQVTDELFVPMRAQRSLLVTSLLEKKTMQSFHRPLDLAPAILDDQIVRFMGKEGMACLPMLAQGNYVGVIVLGLDQAEFSHLSEHLKLLAMFTSQAALAFHVERLRQSQIKTVRTERLGASSAIARKVVHEVNNPLSIIKNYLKILGMKLSEQNLVQDEIRILNEEIDRVVLILHQLTAFSEERTPKIEPVDLNGLLSDLVKLTKDHFMEGAGIQIHCDLDSSLPMMMTEKNGLKQVCINLLKNAAEAMAQGGNLFIQTKYLPPFEEASFEGGQKGSVEILFRDDGPGIPDEVKVKLFEPFVSSKGGAHTGLGLSIVYNIIRTLNGRIACDSEKGSGTTFKIELPIDANSNE